VGVQGDSRTYAQVLSLDGFPTPEAGLQDVATEMINRLTGVNRIVALVRSRVRTADLRVLKSVLSEGRLARLRRLDALVRELSHASGFDRQVWQFPVVLIPVGTPEWPDSVVLRPVHSVDGMTAQSVSMDTELLESITATLLDQEGVCAVFYDLTHKPPATIEWE
jgi:GMP synthase (glutamine-hydrolysing)